MPSSSCTRTQAPRSSRTMSFSPLAAVATTGALAVGCVRMRRRSERTERVSDDGGGAFRFFPLRRIKSASSAKKITPRTITIVSPRVWRAWGHREYALLVSQTAEDLLLHGHNGVDPDLY